MKVFLPLALLALFLTSVYAAELGSSCSDPMVATINDKIGGRLEPGESKWYALYASEAGHFTLKTEFPNTVVSLMSSCSSTVCTATYNSPCRMQVSAANYFVKASSTDSTFQFETILLTAVMQQPPKGAADQEYVPPFEGGGQDSGFTVVTDEEGNVIGVVPAGVGQSMLLNMTEIELVSVDGTYVNLSGYSAYGMDGKNGYFFVSQVLMYDAATLQRHVGDCYNAPAESLGLGYVREVKGWIDQEKPKVKTLCNGASGAYSQYMAINPPLKETISGDLSSYNLAMERCKDLLDSFYYLDGCLNEKLYYPQGSFSLSQYGEFSQTDICKITAQRNPAANAVKGVGNAISSFGAQMVEASNQYGVRMIDEGKKEFDQGGLGWITGGLKMVSGGYEYGIGQLRGGTVEGIGGMISGTANIGNAVGCLTSTATGISRERPALTTIGMAANLVDFFMEDDLHDTLGKTGEGMATYFTEFCPGQPLRCVGHFLPAIAMMVAGGGGGSTGVTKAATGTSKAAVIGKAGSSKVTVLSRGEILSNNMILIPTKIQKTTIYTVMTKPGEVATAASGTFTKIPGVVTVQSGLAATPAGVIALKQMGLQGLNLLWIPNSLGNVPGVQALGKKAMRSNDLTGGEIRGYQFELDTASKYQQMGYRIDHIDLPWKGSDIDIIATAPDGTKVLIETKSSLPNPTTAAIEQSIKSQLSNKIDVYKSYGSDVKIRFEFKTEVSKVYTDFLKSKGVEAVTPSMSPTTSASAVSQIYFAGKESEVSALVERGAQKLGMNQNQLQSVVSEIKVLNTKSEASAAAQRMIQLYPDEGYSASGLMKDAGWFCEKTRTIYLNKYQTSQTINLEVVVEELGHAKRFASSGPSHLPGAIGDLSEEYAVSLMKKDALGRSYVSSVESDIRAAISKADYLDVGLEGMAYDYLRAKNVVGSQELSNSIMAKVQSFPTGVDAVNQFNSLVIKISKGG